MKGPSGEGGYGMVRVRGGRGTAAGVVSRGRQWGGGAVRTVLVVV